ncbi:SDR family NAD(P)-dependent oxidoreductase [Magnetofaba australis]|uniref:Putative short chain dehydrogenase n=1 Tax=Magnetofaba australis IT-1 TaxID=1434232 RepID=A0A1Y2K5T4_9PROT|nr:SDR family oxidoreductase [Magnetofaba australis]OSM04890.1 putative short chain dehydrogenase [Magnetofaba australis IT-1]
MQGLNGKRAVVTGAATGIGLAIARRLSEEGCRTALLDRNVQGAQAQAEALRGQGYDAVGVGVDVADEPSVSAALAQCAALWGGLDILVNNAALLAFHGVDATQQTWERILAVNAIGPALCAKHALAHMPPQGGAIVNIGSISEVIAQPGYLTYSASKGALDSMTRCMAQELAAQGIRVNSVSPGIIWSEATQRITRERYGLGREAADRHPEIGGASLLKRVGDPQEVAAAVAFLASDEARYITGANLVVDGGQSIT